MLFFPQKRQKKIENIIKPIYFIAIKKKSVCEFITVFCLLIKNGNKSVIKCVKVF